MLGVERIAEIPDDFALTALQARVREAHRSGRPFVSTDLASELAPFGPPALYLDFEALMPAEPLYEGTRPYQALPFQWSLHRVDASGSATHRRLPGRRPRGPAPGRRAEPARSRGAGRRADRRLVGLRVARPRRARRGAARPRGASRRASRPPARPRGGDAPLRLPPGLRRLVLDQGRRTRSCARLRLGRSRRGDGHRRRDDRRLRLRAHRGGRELRARGGVRARSAPRLLPAATPRRSWPCTARSASSPRRRGRGPERAVAFAPFARAGVR